MFETSSPFTCCITGATGSLGQALTRFLLEHTQATIRALSRDELKQAIMAQSLSAYQDRVRFFLGDVRDVARLHTAFAGVDCVWHAAALKRIETGEYDPEEFIETNVNGTRNVIRACRTMNVKRAIFISTDKSISPINLYGASKMIAERLWTRANSYTPHGTSYSTIRYGNVTGSRGSVLTVWRQALADNKPLCLTHADMSRFHISLPEAVRLAWFAVQHAPRGSILVPHLPAYSIKTLAQAVVAELGVSWGQVQWQEIGIRPGEKLAEMLCTAEEATTTLTYTEHDTLPLYYCIPPVAPSWTMEPRSQWSHNTAGAWIDEPLAYPYCSDTWPHRLSVEDLRVRLREVTTCSR